MGSAETGNRQRNALPSIDAMEMDRKDGPPYHGSYPTPMSTDLTVKTTPMASPSSSMYPSGPPPPYSSFPSSASSAPSGVPAHSSGYISPDSRRSGEEESRDQPQSQSRPHPTPHQNQTPQKQSLPSIKEALGHDDPYTAPGPTSVPPQQQPPSSSHHPHAPPAQPSSSTLVSRPNPEAPLGPPNPFSSGSPSTPYPHTSTAVPQQSDPQRSSRMSINSQDSRNQSLPSLTSGKSPSQSSRTGAPSLNSQASSYEYGAPPPHPPPQQQQPAGNMSSPSGYYAHQPFHYPVPGSTYPPPTLDQRPAYLGPPWKPGGPDAMQVDDGKGMFRGSNGSGAQPHSESVKRHLDGYDVEASLNEISEGSSRTVEFARMYGARAHQAQRSGPLLGSLPALSEVEEMMQVQRRNADAFARIQSAIMTQEHAMAEQRQRQQQQQQQQQQQRHHYKDNGYADEAGMFQEEFKGAGGFAGADSKKRRGKAAPPGRCHSCNRAETPEWRRGPDGARTLCNACGLHYAKLTRKLGANKASSLGSNLQPKRGSGSVEATTSPPRHMAVQGQPPPPPSAVQPPPPPTTHHHHHQHM